MEACPNYGPQSDYIGAATVNQARLFNLHPSGKMHDEVRLDATLGIRVWRNLSLLAQSFNTVSAGKGGYGFPATRFSKVELSAVYDLDRRWSVQLGAIATIAGRNALRERGVELAVWRRF